jgi:hypothetical protein
MVKPVKKSAMPCNSPRSTPTHPKKSHVVKACEGGKEKVIRFGQQGKKVGTVSGTAGKPKAGESDRMKAKRKCLKGNERGVLGANRLKERASRIKHCQGQDERGVLG